MDKPKRQLLDGTDLVLRCHEIHDIAQQIGEKLAKILKDVATTDLAYTFRSRSKTPNKILDKVLRKRAEGVERDDPKLKVYDPDHVTDAWACRYVTLYQSQIPRVVEKLLSQLEAYNGEKDSPDVTLSEFVIYTNRPKNDPLSIVNEVMGILERASLPSVVDRETIIRQPENKKSAYSSVHLVCMLPLVCEFAGAPRRNEDGKFEIQIRDIFEEGWGEIQHNLVYSRKESAGSFAEDDELTGLWRPHLNALKTFVDGCSQHASIIQNSYEITILRKAPSSHSSDASRDEHRNAIVEKLKKKNNATAAATVGLAYDFLKQANDDEIEADLANVNFRASAAKFEEALIQTGSLILETPPRLKGHRTIEYFLKLEIANCYLAVKDDGDVAELRRARELCEDMMARYPTDATIKFRYAQAVARLDSSKAGIGEAIQKLEQCIELLPGDDLLGQYSWMSLSARIHLGFFYWRLAKLAEEWKDRSAEQNALETAVRVTAEAVDIWESEPEEVRRSDDHSLFAHKAASNILYYQARLSKLRDNVARDIRAWLKKVQNIHVPFYREYFKTRDNMMHAYAAIGEFETATKYADETYREFFTSAERRAARRLRAEEIETYLRSGELPNFRDAVEMLRLNLKSVP